MPLSSRCDVTGRLQSPSFEIEAAKLQRFQIQIMTVRNKISAKFFLMSISRRHMKQIPQVLNFYKN